ncbi:Hemerythrin HHE cation binding domain-containing protein [Raineyella antarctica]|uniref:Hemerythrin HHE cation binding domain-containing protein n=1 Tax=Raineyella antarctica TaxID=1577474 RepID=A0A1G6GH58_9ACTN|nr:hemerythrin domain-containing protein [Raineyella antarctica]SDB81163.1 Hemerythrin HHE cation binding domain-containing protein [Raineyella antarctica]
MTLFEIPRPVSGDVVDLIIDDHRMFETLLRELRDATADRATARATLANLLIAHGEAEEAEVYPRLRREDAITGHEEHHGHVEHAAGNEALLALLEAKGTDTQKFDSAVEKLAEAINHHLGEEEQTILNGARADVSAKERAELGQAWLTRRSKLLDQDCGDIENVRRIVAEAAREGLLEEAESEE